MDSILNQRKLQIVNAAIKVISEKNLKEATMREIAAEAGLTTGAIYYHYKNKEDLFQDIVDHTIHLVYSVSGEKGKKSQEELLRDVQDAVADRISRITEQRLHILLLNDVISKNDTALSKYRESYKRVIEETGDMYYHTFGVENNEQKAAIGAILVGALDGIAILQTLDVLPEETNKMIEIFNDFFSESIPAYLEKHQ